MTRLPGEEFVCELTATDYFLYQFPTRQRTLRLTTHRVRYQESVAGGQVLKSIMLEEVGVCVMSKNRKPVVVVLVILLGLYCGWIIGWLLLAEFLRQSNTAGIIGVGLGLGFGSVLALFFLLWREEVLRITAAGGEITFVVQGTLNMSVVHAFIDDLEAAKNRRFLAVRVETAKE